MLLSFLVIFSSTKLTPFLIYNKKVAIILLTFDLLSFFPLYFLRSIAEAKSFLFHERKKCIRWKQLNDTTSWNQVKMNWKWAFVYYHLIWITVIKVSLCLEGHQGNFFFFLQQNKVNLRTSAYIFYKYSTLANMKYAASDTVLRKIWVLRKMNLLILQFAATPTPPTKQPKYLG